MSILTYNEGSISKIKKHTVTRDNVEQKNGGSPQGPPPLVARQKENQALSRTQRETGMYWSGGVSPRSSASRVSTSRVENSSLEKSILVSVGETISAM